MAMTTVVTVALLAGYVVSATQDNAVTIETNVGTIVGFQKDVDIFGKPVKVARFLGIPYAEPPIGDLRFRKPVPKAPFTSPLIAKQHGNVCLQRTGIMPPGCLETHDSEDCLFLNVYAPASSSRGGLPVMIWIHGGGFFAGSSNMYASDTIAGFGDVIVVTLNYRLSVWGFFTTGPETGPGNYGLWDQHMAIRWVHDNIRAFGGDAGRVTIFGESAGSASVVYQSLYEGNRGLFHRVIGQSGGIAAIWAGTTEQKAESERLGRLLGCDTSDPELLHDCVKSKPASLLNATINDITTDNLIFPVPFRPVIDGAFIQENRQDVFTANSNDNKHPFFSSLQFMAGMMSAEGACLARLAVEDDLETMLPSRKYFEETLIPVTVRAVLGQDVPETVITATIAQYTDWSDPENPENIRDMFIRLTSDVFMTASIMSVVNFHADNSGDDIATYLYQLNVNPTYHYIPTPSWFKHSNHVDDLIYLFGYGGDGMLAELCQDSPTFTDWEIQLAKEMLTMWTNFAKTGDPNKPTSVQQEWPKYNLATQKYLDMTEDMSHGAVKRYLFASYENFWNKVVPSILRAAGSHLKTVPLVSDQEGTCQKDKCSP